ncbi:MAG: FAD-dependent oxidoreductase [Candidatus Lokiarchaeota archaeon]
MKPIRCLRNARAADERKKELNPIEEKKKIMVIGSGPAGLESARIAKRRGHEVHIFEKSDQIGGLINIIWRPPGRNEFIRMKEDYEYWIQDLGIPVHLNTKVDLEKVKEFDPDAVFICTGSIPIKPPIKGINLPHVYWANDVFSDNAPVGDNVVIIGGGATGIELALYIAKYGSLDCKAFEFLTFYDALETNIALKKLYKGKKKVTVLEKLPKLGSALGKTTKWVLLDKCDKLGVKMLTNVNVKEIGEDNVLYTDKNGNEQILQNVDNVYYATGVHSNDELFSKIKRLNKKIDVQKIGDARKPQTVLEATERAYKVANRI